MRSLHQAGYEIVAGTSGQDWVFTHSRHVQETWRHPPIEGTGEEFIRALVEFLRIRADIAVVFPVDECSVSCLARHVDRLPATVTPALATPEAVLTCVDKARLHQITLDLGVPIAPYRVAPNTAEIYQSADALGYPCVVKPTGNAGIMGKKALLVRSRDHLRRLLPEDLDRPPVIVQRYAGDGRKNVYFAARDGEILQECQTRIFRTDKIDGTGLVVDGTTVPIDRELHEYTSRLARRLRYTGVGCAQFQMNTDTGHFSFLEINPRLCGATGIVVAAGLDMPALVVDLATGRHVENLPENFYPAGRRYVWRQRDIGGFAWDLRRGNVGPLAAARWMARIARSYLRNAVDVGWSWSDPVPYLANWFRGVGRIFGREDPAIARAATRGAA
ncbi:MAG: ATP-grasp domain-containing protein [bacterium]|nr:ATP-grasp domain-containing protein [bacterium]